MGLAEPHPSVATTAAARARRSLRRTAATALRAAAPRGSSIDSSARGGRFWGRPLTPHQRDRSLRGGAFVELLAVGMNAISLQQISDDVPVCFAVEAGGLI